ncbi:MAG: sigma 54-interacting transcriptional regulator [Paludisphaera borealis]|uniref:sigma-54-dependent transcriptional regulator n=1 Tax=Paludisphaera borealis TaxID=1387353 RepID=UPI00283DE989|nr:sigma 54-interacting transcriptional regulator [Paludisphaera borealis]MDR3621299.1 sigma 54-interacting transcriptional regulator [Paludisphaera borealis]
MSKFRILIVCPDAAGLALLTSMLKSLGHDIEEAANDRVAVRQMERSPVNLVLASVDPGDGDCLELLTYVRRKHSEAPVVLMFPRLHPDRAKEALRQGAMAVLKYPVPAAELRAAVLQALEQCESKPVSQSTNGVAHSAHDPAAGLRPMSQATTSASSAPTLTVVVPPSSASSSPPPPSPQAGASSHGAGSARDGLVGTDPSLKQIVVLAGALSTGNSTVLLVGEPGTGKSELAHYLHLGSGQNDRPFVTLHAAELADTSSLGEHGTTAMSPRNLSLEWTTKLAQAAGGTLYIEEVGSLAPELQLQLLRELQLHDMEAAAGHSGGFNRALARLVLSTSETLASLVEQGKFRQDLYHRISPICLMVPPLRHRGADVELLAEHFRARFTQQFGRHVVGFSRDALDVLVRHDWPGNVRELQGVIQRAVALCNAPRITAAHLTPIINPHRGNRGPAAGAAPRPHLEMGIRPLKEALEEPEKRIIIHALQALNWNRQETARVLDINRTTLYKKMKKYGLLVDEPMWVN